MIFTHTSLEFVKEYIESPVVKINNLFFFRMLVNSDRTVQISIGTEVIKWFSTLCDFYDLHLNRDAGCAHKRDRPHK